MSFTPKLGFQRTFGDYRPADLRQFEATTPLGKLPDPYREFLQATNGGTFDLSTESLDGDGDFGVGCSKVGEDFAGEAVDACLVETMYGLFQPDDIDDLRSASDKHGFRQAVPSRFLAIADSSLRTNQICISLEGDDFGKIYYWHGEPWRVESTPNMTYLKPIAANFQEFWDRLQLVEFG